MTVDPRFIRQAAKAIFTDEVAWRDFAIKGAIRAGLTFDSKALGPAKATA